MFCHAFFTCNCHTPSLIGVVLLMHSAPFSWYNFVSEKGPINPLGFLVPIVRYRTHYMVSCHVEMCTFIVTRTTVYVIPCAICPLYDLPVFDNKVSLSWVQLSTNYRQPHSPPICLRYEVDFVISKSDLSSSGVGVISCHRGPLYIEISASSVTNVDMTCCNGLDGADCVSAVSSQWYWRSLG